MPKYSPEKQSQALERMRAELERLNAQADELKKSMNIADESELDPDPAKVPPQLSEAFAASRKAAEEAGRSAAAALEAETAESDPGAARPVSRRRGLAV